MKPTSRCGAKWTYLYRAVDKAGNAIDFLLSARRNKAAGRRYFESAIGHNGVPDTVTIDKSRADLAALHAVNAERETPIRIRQRKDPNKIIEQDHRPSSDEHGRCWASRASVARASLWRGST